MDRDDVFESRLCSNITIILIGERHVATHMRHCQIFSTSTVAYLVSYERVLSKPWLISINNLATFNKQSANLVSSVGRV